MCKLTTYLKSFDGEIKITMCFYTFDRDKYIHKVLDIHHIFPIHPVTRPFEISFCNCDRLNDQSITPHYFFFSELLVFCSTKESTFP